MKKPFSYFFLLVFIFSAIGYYPVFLFQQDLVRKEIKQKIKNSIPEKELTVFSFSPKEYADLVWVKPGKEFHYKNDMYDIVKNRIGNNNNILLFCLNDFKEKQLFSNLEREVKEQSGNSSNEKNLPDIFKILAYCNDYASAENLFMPVLGYTIPPTYSNWFFLSYFQKKPSPPPKQA